MKRALLFIFSTIISFNLGAIIIILKKYGFNFDIKYLLEIHYEVSIYAFQCGCIAFIAGMIYKRSIKSIKSKEDKGN